MHSGIFALNLTSAKTRSMKKLLTSFCLAALSYGAFAQTTANAAPDVLQVKQTEHDFGQIPQGKPVYTYFEVANTGAVPLKLQNVQASCGCTTPEWNREAIPAGSTDKIRVGYNAANEGYFEKYITIQYNDNQTKQIRIKGTVWKAPVGSAPANESVQILKQQNL
jgi:hypothetical protein